MSKKRNLGVMADSCKTRARDLRQEAHQVSLTSQSNACGSLQDIKRDPAPEHEGGELLRHDSSSCPTANILLWIPEPTVQ